jgi:hypothetical protein
VVIGFSVMGWRPASRVATMYSWWKESTVVMMTASGLVSASTFLKSSAA